MTDKNDNQVLQDFIEIFKNTETYEGDVQDYDYSNLNGAFVYTNNIEIYQFCVYLGIRVIGSNVGDYRFDTSDLISLLKEEKNCNILILEKDDIDCIDIEMIKEISENLNKIVYVHDQDSRLEFLHKVNVLRTKYDNFC